MIPDTQFDYEQVHRAIRDKHPRHQFAGLVKDTGAILRAFCANPHCSASGLKPAMHVDDDPFSGRIPTARELEEYFNPDHGNAGVNLDDELRVKHKPTTPLHPPFELTQQRYLLINRRGEEHIVIFYSGQCPDCATVLYAIVDPV